MRIFPILSPHLFLFLSLVPRSCLLVLNNWILPLSPPFSFSLFSGSFSSPPISFSLFMIFSLLSPTVLPRSCLLEKNWTSLPSLACDDSVEEDENKGRGREKRGQTEGFNARGRRETLKHQWWRCLQYRFAPFFILKFLCFLNFFFFFEIDVGLIEVEYPDYCIN